VTVSSGVYQGSLWVANGLEARLTGRRSPGSLRTPPPALRRASSFSQKPAVVPGQKLVVPKPVNLPSIKKVSCDPAKWRRAGRSRHAALRSVYRSFRTSNSSRGPCMAHQAHLCGWCDAHRGRRC
jgi:hypothetical protein